MAGHVRAALNERLERAEESPFFKRTGLICALILASVIALASAHYLWP